MFHLCLLLRLFKRAEHVEVLFKHDHVWSKQNQSEQTWKFHKQLLLYVLLECGSAENVWHKVFRENEWHDSPFWLTAVWPIREAKLTVLTNQQLRTCSEWHEWKPVLVTFFFSEVVNLISLQVPKSCCEKSRDKRAKIFYSLLCLPLLGLNLCWILNTRKLRWAGT